MSVSQDLTNLLQLQELDLKTRDIRNELDNIPTEIEEIKANVETVRVILQKEQDKLTEAEGWRREKEADIDLQNELQNKSKNKLQAARNEKESKAAQREIDTLKKNISDNEKELVELMEAIEQYREAIEEHKKEFAELEEHLADRVSEGETRMSEIRTLLETADEDRKSLMVNISKPNLRLYERIHRRFGQSIIQVSEPRCAGCHLKIRPQTYIELQRGETLITCPQCMRILYYKTDETEEPSGQVDEASTPTVENQ